MEKTLLSLLFILGFMPTYAQLNPFPQGTTDYTAYHYYLNSRDKNWKVFYDSIMPLWKGDKRTVKPAATQIIYQMGQSVGASCTDKNVEKAQKHLNNCDELLKKYEDKKTAFWSDEDYSFFEGMKDFWQVPLNTWRPWVKNKGYIANIAENAKIPDFPFPPPAASSSTIIPKSFLQNCSKLGDIDTKLNTILAQNGYERSYFKVPNGFALVSRLEQITTDASPMKDPNRWADKIPPVENFSEYMSALFFPRVGYFRIVVFVVTDVPFSQKQESASKLQAAAWLAEGSNALPLSISKIPINENFNCTALIYEFQFTESQKSSISKRFSAQVHLEKAKLWNRLR